MKVGLLQLNPIVGDLSGNCRKIVDAVNQCADSGADLIVTGELVVSGYPPKDLLLREGFVRRCDEAVAEIARQIPDHVGLIVGHPTAMEVPEGRIANGASFLEGGEVRAVRHKCLLPNYDVFDERRYFRPAEQTSPIEFRGVRLGVHICEDAWFHEPSTGYTTEPHCLFDPVKSLAEQGSELLINLSASPFEVDKRERRLEIVSQHATQYGLRSIFVNQVGGNDDLVFDGNSFIVDPDGRVSHQLAPFQEAVEVVDLESMPSTVPSSSRSRTEDQLDALVLGLGDYIRKCGFRECVLGLSGGIDSALACYIAAQAVGAQNVHGLLMPSRHSSEHSVDDARQLAEAIGVDYSVIPIDQVQSAYESTTVLETDLGSEPGGLADQNLQARIRGAMVMIRSNRYGWLALATGNKSELAVGYCTLYGDMAGGFAVLCDVFKHDVYAMCRFINEHREGREVIPNSTIDKPPSAELAPDQVDQDTLPPYPVLDGILKGLIEDELSIQSLTEEYDEETVRWVIQRLDRNEFKRRQMPPGIKLSQRAFGSGRRMPMAARIDYDTPQSAD